MPKAGFFLIEDNIAEVFASQKILLETRARMEALAPQVIAYAKGNAPWTDRTGAARAGLGVEVTVEGEEVVMDLFHTVDYGYWLETIQSGEFAIIMPTLEYFAPQVMAATDAVPTGEDLG